jgi:hypothetical protein
MLTFTLVLGVEFLNADEASQINGNWFTLTGSVLYVPILVSCISLTLGQVLNSTKLSIQQESDMNAAQIRLAIQESIAEERAERLKAEEKHVKSGSKQRRSSVKSGSKQRRSKMTSVKNQKNASLLCTKGLLTLSTLFKLNLEQINEL